PHLLTIGLEIVESSKLISLKLWHGVPLLAQASLCVKPSGATFALNSPDKSGSKQLQFLRLASLKNFWAKCSNWTR
ncbi:MAG: hypothetical protein JSV60_02825, partial [Desulfobacterales bacterium]